MTAITFVARGDAVDVLGHGSIKAAVESAGLTFSAFPSAASWDAANPSVTLKLLGMLSDRAMGNDVVAQLRARKTRLVVVDCLLFGVIQSLQAAGVEVHGWLDHSEALRSASLVINHGGYGTTIAALAHGLPVLVMPLDSKGDQPFIGASIEALATDGT